MLLKSTPRRGTSVLESLLTEIRLLRTDFNELKEKIPGTIDEALRRQANSRKVVLTGFPEGTTTEKVRELFSMVGIPPDAVGPLYPLGKAEPTGHFRNMCTEIGHGYPYPHLKTLHQHLKSLPAHSRCSVRRFETPEQRHQGFLEREERRRLSSIANQPITVADPVVLETPRPSSPPPSVEPRPSQTTPVLLSQPIDPLFETPALDKIIAEFKDESEMRKKELAEMQRKWLQKR